MGLGFPFTPTKANTPVVCTSPFWRHEPNQKVDLCAMKNNAQPRMNCLSFAFSCFSGPADFTDLTFLSIPNPLISRLCTLIRFFSPHLLYPAANPHVHLPTRMSATANPTLQAFIASLSSEKVWAQVLIQPANHTFTLRHVADRDLPLDQLKSLSVNDIRKLTMYTASGQFRPLRSSPDLQRGWVFTCNTPEELWRALQELYPGSIPDWFARPDVQSSGHQLSRLHQSPDRHVSHYPIPQRLPGRQRCPRRLPLPLLPQAAPLDRSRTRPRFTRRKIRNSVPRTLRHPCWSSPARPPGSNRKQNSTSNSARANCNRSSPPRKVPWKPRRRMNEPATSPQRRIQGVCSCCSRSLRSMAQQNPTERKSYDW